MCYCQFCLNSSLGPLGDFRTELLLVYTLSPALLFTHHSPGPFTQQLITLAKRLEEEVRTYVKGVRMREIDEQREM